MATEYGLLLPHFGPETDRDRIIGGARRAEQMGFDSVWVRDHLVFHPHGMEGTDNTFIDPFIVLAALGAATTKIKLGFGSLIPHRHPILLALMLNSLGYMAGDRLLLSLGLGTFQQEFDAIGMGEWPRDEVVREQVGILRKICNGITLPLKVSFIAFTTWLSSPNTRRCSKFGTPEPHPPRYAARWNTVMAGCPAGSLWPPIASA